VDKVYSILEVTELATTLDQEVRRHLKYVELTVQELGEKIKETVAKGLSFDLVILKDGKPVEEVPAGLAVVLAGIGLLPQVRVIALFSAATAGLTGYTFKFAQKPGETPKE
jgi:hypothetical protein